VTNVRKLAWGPLRHKALHRTCGKTGRKESSDGGERGKAGKGRILSPLLLETEKETTMLHRDVHVNGNITIHSTVERRSLSRSRVGKEKEKGFCAWCW